MKNHDNLNVHRGHRNRLTKRYLASLGEDFSEHELLELVLFYSLPRRNTNTIAHELIERFGTINRMVEASVDELKLVDGIGDKSAVLLKLLLSLAKRYANEEKRPIKRLETLQKAAEYAISQTMGAQNELVYAIFMDNSLNMIDSNLIAIGNIDEAKPLIRTVLELSLVKRATVVMLAHNHPRGGTAPTPADIEFTTLLERELEMIGVHLLEHIIVGQNEFNPLMKTLRKSEDITKQVDVKKFYSLK